MVCWLQLPWRLLLNIKIHFIYSYRSHYWCFLVCWLQLPRRHFFNVKINLIYNYRNHYWCFLVCWLQLPWRCLFNVKINFIYNYRNHYWCFLVCWLQLPWRRLFNVKINFIPPTHRVGAIFQSPCPSVHSHFRNRYLSFYWKKWFYIWYMALAWWLVPCHPFPGLPHIYFLFTVRLRIFLYLIDGFGMVTCTVSPLSRFTAHLLPVYRATYKWTSGGILSTT